MKTHCTTRKEWITYLVMWLIMFLAPLASMYAHAAISDNIEFHWNPVLHLWDGIVIMLIIFLIHNHFLAPLPLYQHKWKGYVLGVLLLCGGFTLYMCVSHPPIPPRMEMNNSSNSDSKPNMEQPGKIGGNSTNTVEFHHQHSHKPPHNGQRPPLRPNDLMSIILLMFILATNIGLKNLFKNMKEADRKKDIEKEFLLQRLDYLKYQVNPHFLMNTLNNIHALVDIEPEDAKASIVKLSHLLRYVLYDGAKSTIPLDRGIVFLNNYIDLMRMRYQDNVDIVFDYPSPIPNVDVLPLLVITFVENAFKHGVSYAKHSFIHISIQVEDNRLIFTCSNSKHNENQRESIEHGGFGIDNVVKRMELMFGNKYEFEVHEDDASYQVRLIFPLDQIH